MGDGQKNNKQPGHDEQKNNKQPGHDEQKNADDGIQTFDPAGVDNNLANDPDQKDNDDKTNPVTGPDTQLDTDPAPDAEDKPVPGLKDTEYLCKGCRKESSIDIEKLREQPSKGETNKFLHD